MYMMRIKRLDKVDKDTIIYSKYKWLLLLRIHVALGLTYGDKIEKLGTVDEDTFNISLNGIQILSVTIEDANNECEGQLAGAVG